MKNKRKKQSVPESIEAFARILELKKEAGIPKDKISGFEGFLLGNVLKGVDKESEIEKTENEIKRLKLKLKRLKQE